MEMETPIIRDKIVSVTNPVVVVKDVETRIVPVSDFFPEFN